MVTRPKKDYSSVPHAGRASGTPSLDVFITLLSLGGKGYRQLCVDRKVRSSVVYMVNSTDTRVCV